MALDLYSLFNLFFSSSCILLFGMFFLRSCLFLFPFRGSSSYLPILAWEVSARPNFVALFFPSPECSTLFFRFPEVCFSSKTPPFPWPPLVATFLPPVNYSGFSIFPFRSLSCSTLTIFQLTCLFSFFPFEPDLSVFLLPG